MKATAKHLRWILPAGLILGALLSWLQPGTWWVGWLSFSAILVLGAWLLMASCRWAGGGRTLAWTIALAFLLRLALGTTLTLALPVAGYDTNTQNAGYVFFDAFQRDTQAWELAQSSEPVWAAFNQSYSSDQYGGLLAFSALAYRYLSPDAHRPVLVILLGALAAALGVPILWLAAKKAWGERVAVPAVWLLALYPESILQGSAQMREPFLVTLVAVAVLGTVLWQQGERRAAYPWLGISLAGLLLVSPGIAFWVVVMAAGWLGLSRGRSKVSLRTALMAAAVLAASAVLLLWGISRMGGTGESFSTVLSTWFRDVVLWDVYLLEANSDWVAGLFDQMPAQLQVPFAVGYGLAQPVLPAALIEPTIPLWRAVGIFRATGWYLLLPFLVYSVIVVFKTPHGEQRRVWVWLAVLAWAWVLLAALRGGGDQWDNPRYRVILLSVQALLASQAWLGWREKVDAWFARILAVEAEFLVIFTLWYASRYGFPIGRLPFFVMLALIAGLAVLIIAGGFIWDHTVKSRTVGG